MTHPTLVVGATGTVGGLLVGQLVRRGVRVRAASRDPRGAVGRIPAGAEPVAFDLEDAATFAPALTGVGRVFLIARPGDDAPERVALPLIDAMRRGGVGRVVNLTAMGVETRDDLGLRRVERYLESSGMEWTHLRPNWFMEVFTSGPLLADLRGSGGLHLPAGDARISYVHAGDIAAVAAEALCGSGHAGRAYTLTGPEALDHHAVVAHIGQAAGRTFEYVPISDETARAAIVGSGLSAVRADRLLGFYRLVRAGACAAVAEDVATVLGRAPTHFAQFAAEHAKCWQ